MEERRWEQQYVSLPYINGKKIVLVPKSLVRLGLSLDSQEYYTHYVLNFLKQEHLDANSSLVHLLKNGGRKVYKKDLKEIHPFNKVWLAQFSEQNPEVLENYKLFVKNLPGAAGVLTTSEIDDSFDEAAFSASLTASLKNISAGSENAYRYHSIIVGVLEFLLWPNLTYPKKEMEIHEGRKRIDISYTNAARDGLFYRIHTAHDISSNEVMVECKNYSKDPKNPELDQISGRFSTNRGRFGLLVYRNTTNYDLLLQRCKDTARDGRGFVLPLGDEHLVYMLSLISAGNRKDIDRYLNDIFVQLLT